jgi:ADP-heptose:LPS heptosyltransferase
VNPRPPPRHILVISLAGAGDTLLATPLLRELRTAFPAAEIDVLTMQGAAPREVLDGNPAISAWRHFDFLREGRVRSVAFCLAMRRRRYDLSFTVMPQNRLEYNLITWLIGARERLGFEFCSDCGSHPHRFLTRTIREDRRLHVVDNNLRLFTEGLGLSLASVDPRPHLHLAAEHEAAAEAFCAAPPLLGRRPIGFHPGSGTTKNLALKRWPSAQWADLARRVASADPRVYIVLFGSADEIPLRREIASSSCLPPDRIGMAPDGSVRATAALIRRMACFVCGDTLLTHVAAAVGAPTVEIVGPTDPVATGPYKTPHRIVRLGLPCSPCYFFSKHGIACTHATPMACLSGLEAARVETAVLELMDETGQSGRQASGE